MRALLTALYADEQGEIFDAPGYLALGRVGGTDMVLTEEDVIPLPDGSDLAFLPGCSALASHKGQKELIAPSLMAVAALLPMGYTRTHLPAYVKQAAAPFLPLYGYTAVAIHHNQMVVAAIKSDSNAKWHPHRYNTPGLSRKIALVKKALPGNRLVEHLANCSLSWHCSTAQNLFYRRWEAGLPVSPACNANCLGCISLQPAECCPSPQSRIGFSPTVAEVVAIGSYHLSGGAEPIISFGQGCEGEPALAADTIAAAIKSIRAHTGQGVINMNTNAGFTAGIRAIVDAGIDSIRVSMISANQQSHQAYYRCDYSLEDVSRSIGYAKAHGVYVSLNMLLLPGLNDRQEELSAWLDFIGSSGVDMIQLRNLNIDPDLLWPHLPQPKGELLGVKYFIKELRQRFAALSIGNFSRYISR